jgi:hypothetical protein
MPTGFTRRARELVLTGPDKIAPVAGGVSACEDQMKFMLFEAQ